MCRELTASGRFRTLSGDHSLSLWETDAIKLLLTNKWSAVLLLFWLRRDIICDLTSLLCWSDQVVWLDWLIEITCIAISDPWSALCLPSPKETVNDLVNLSLLLPFSLCLRFWQSIKHVDSAPDILVLTQATGSLSISLVLGHHRILLHMWILPSSIAQHRIRESINHLVPWFLWLETNDRAVLWTWLDWLSWVFLYVVRAWDHILLEIAVCILAFLSRQIVHLWWDIVIPFCWWLSWMLFLLTWICQKLRWNLSRGARSWIRTITIDIVVEIL